MIYRLRSGKRSVQSVCSHRLLRPPNSTISTLFPHAIVTAGAVIHSHAICSVLASQFLAQDSVFRCTELEMIKGISGHSYTDTLTVRLCNPVCCLSLTFLDPTGADHREHGPRMRPRRVVGGALSLLFLVVSSHCGFLQAAVRQHPRTYAVIVKNHGVYIWGTSWQQAKQHAEVYHYLFDLCLQMRAHSCVTSRS